MSDINSSEKLKSYVQRILKLEEEKAEVAEFIKGVYHEAKNDGFDTKILRKVVAFEKKTPEERDNERALFDLYVDTVEGKNQ